MSEKESEAMAEEEQQQMDTEVPATVEEPTDPLPEWGEDISPEKDGGVFKTIVTEGSAEDGSPMNNDEVFVHYTGKLLDGTVFDSSVERNEPFSFKLGMGAVIKGWDVGVATMKKGEKCILTCRPGYAYGEKGSGPKIPPNSTLRFDVELLSWKGEDISKDGGVMKSIVTEGKEYSRPSDGAKCNVHIRGTYKEKVFEERDVDFDYGEGSEEGLLRGVEMAIGQMKVEESAKVTVSSKYGFGEAGSPEHDIPGEATLVYFIRLNSFQKPKANWEYDSVEERRTEAERLKEKGTNYFKESKWALAQKLYERGSDLISDSQLSKDEEKEMVKTLRIALHLNQAACHLKLNEPSLALKECEEVTRLDTANVKAYFRRGQARQLLQDYEEAIGDFQEVLKLEPQNKAAQKQLALSRKRLKEEREKERKRYRNMFSNFGRDDDENNKVGEKMDTSAEPEVEAGGKAEEQNQEDTPVQATSE